MAPENGPERCRDISSSLGEEATASAAVTRAWLLVEHPGPWKRDPFATGFDPEVAVELARRAKRANVRLLAVRRPDASSAERSGGRSVTAVHCHPSRPWMATAHVDHERALLDLDLPGLAEGVVPAGYRHDPGPAYLVCTHAGRDGCCGRLGRPLAVAMESVRPGQVRECSHLGGHRFAANLLCLPTGLLYGRVAAGGHGERLAAAHERGEVEVDLDHLRGLCWQSPAEQAADYFLRRHLDLTDIAAVGPVTSRADGDQTWTVVMDAGTARWQAEVAWEPTGTPRAISCGAEETEDPGTWELSSLAQVDRPRW